MRFKSVVLLGAACFLSGVGTTVAEAVDDACLGATLGTIATSGKAQDTAISIRQLVSMHPYGGTALANQIRDALVANLKNFPEAFGLLPEASPSQVRSLGMGMGQAAAMCLDRRPAAALDIQRKVAELGRVDVAQAFEAGSGLSLSTPLRSRNGACLDGTVPFASENISAFNLAPNKLLSDNPLGGSALSSTVRSLAIGDPAVVASILSVTASASTLQKSAIGAGLGQAVMACEQRDPAVAQAIQRFVAATNDTQLMTLFQAVAGGAQTASVGVSGPATGGGPVAAGGIASSGPVSVGLSGAGAPPQFQRQSEFQFAVNPDGITTRVARSRTISVFSSVSP